MNAKIKSYKIVNFINDTRGVAILELALIFPLLVLLFVGIIEFGFMVNEWRRLNDLVEAQVLYLSASNCGSSTSCNYPSNSEQFYNTAPASASSITNAVNEVASRIKASNATPNVTLACGCATGSGAAATITLDPNAFTPASAPFCHNPSGSSTCSEQHLYANVGATKQYEGFFLDHVITPSLKLSLLPLLSASALVRIH